MTEKIQMMVDTDFIIFWESERLMNDEEIVNFISSMIMRRRHCKNLEPPEWSERPSSFLKQNSYVNDGLRAVTSRAI